MDISGNRLYGGLIVWQQGTAVQFLNDQLSKTHYGDEFHNYTMVWQQDKLTLMVDDEVYGELYDGLPFFNEKCFLILESLWEDFSTLMIVFLPKTLSPTGIGNLGPPFRFGNSVIIGRPLGESTAQ